MKGETLQLKVLRIPTSTNKVADETSKKQPKKRNNRKLRNDSKPNKKMKRLKENRKEIIEKEHQEDTLEKEEKNEDILEDDSEKNVEMQNTESENDQIKQKEEKKESLKKYIPPHLRKREEMTPLHRQIKRLVNKISVPNLASCLQEIQMIYSNNSRNETNRILSEFLLNDVCDQTMVFTQSVTVPAQMALISILHSNIGIEIGSAFVERLVHLFEEKYQQQSGTECKNLVLLFAYLYSFQVIHCVLIYNLIRIFVDHFTELDLELLLILLKYSGPQLRADDPSALKDIILKVQEQTSKRNIHIKESISDSTVIEENETTFNARARFMLQTIYNLKNNKMATSDSILNVKKQMKVLTSKKSGENPLRVQYEDFLAVESKGRWWLVGTAWSGREDSSKPLISSNSFDDKILALAKAQRMNTDIRRSIFCVIMTSEDYIDAFEKLLKLNLKSKQDREIIYVLLHCCLQEKIFNPFYAHLAVKLCSHSHNLKFTFQYAFWDRFKQFDSLTLTQISNLAKLFVYMITAGSISLAVLKVIEFTHLKSHGILFLRLVFTQLFTEHTEETVKIAFERLLNAKKETIVGLREGIAHFFLQEELHNNQKETLTPTQRDSYKKNRRIAKRILEKVALEEYDLDFQMYPQQFHLVKSKKKE